MISIFVGWFGGYTPIEDPQNNKRKEITIEFRLSINDHVSVVIHREREREVGNPLHNCTMIDDHLIYFGFFLYENFFCRIFGNFNGTHLISIMLI